VTLFSLTDTTLSHHEDLHYTSIDTWLTVILWIHAFVVVLCTFTIFWLQPSHLYPTPFSWDVLSALELQVLTVGSFVAALLPTLLRGRVRNHYLYRLIMMGSYMLFSFLLVMMSGGSTEMHFYLFGIWALLTLYGDERLIWIGFLLMLVHHVILNFAMPEWLYQYGRNDLSLISYVLFAFPAALFTAWIAKSKYAMIEQISAANTFIKSKI
jgi:hypothetical protein